nr:SDR family NAD(P)-dependent oxidoreductase [Saprospiraceae bacterium]
MSKSIFITGITSGIGLASAVKLHGEGHRVTGLIRDIPKGEKLKTGGQLPEEVELIECDLADLSSVSK